MHNGGPLGPPIMATGFILRIAPLPSKGANQLFRRMAQGILNDESLANRWERHVCD